jgi:predicted Fe-S protein YdhL (DUF1289 family)
MSESVASPCNKICVMDPRTGLCRGCGRTLDEIARWSQLSAAERAAILRALPERMSRPDLP